MIIFVSLSKRLPRIRIENCTWFRFIGKRSVHIENDLYESTIEEKDVYGLARRRNEYYILLKSDPEYVFPIDAKTVRSLLNRSKTYAGTVKGVRVKTDKHLVSKEPSVKPNPAARNEATLYEVADVPKRGELTDITKAIRLAKIDGAQKLKFLSTVTLPTGAQYFYYDASATYPEYDPKDKGQDHSKWEEQLEKAVLKAVRDMGLIIGAAPMKHNNKMIPVLILVNDEVL